MSLQLIIGIGIVTAYFIFMGYIASGFYTKFGAFGISLIEILILLAVLYAESASINYTLLMKINFWMMFPIMFFIGVVSLFKLSVRLLDPTNTEKEKPKWEDDAW